MKYWEIIFSGLTAFGTVAVAVLAIWGDYIRAHLVPGRLAIEIYEEDGDTVGQPPNQVYYRHLRVVNRRPWRHGGNCRVLLRGMSRRAPNGMFHPIPIPVPLQFIWTPPDTMPPLVAIHRDQILDFVYIRQGANLRWEPRLYWKPGNFAGFVGPNEAIRYSLQIVSDAYVSETDQVFQVAFDGVWDPVPAQMMMHLTIDEIA
jgi:hypothetical protein